MNNANYQPQRKCELSALIEIQQALGLFFLILLFATLFTGGWLWVILVVGGWLRGLFVRGLFLVWFGFWISNALCHL